MKNGPVIPGWAAGVGIAALVVVLLVVGAKYVSGEGPLPESQYPKQAYMPPNYTPPPGTYTKDGKPIVGGREAATSSAPAPSSSNPYAGYGQR